MDDLPYYCFPSCPTKEEINNPKVVFENYGAWKSIVTEKHGDEEIVLARHVCALNSRNMRGQNTSGDYEILQERCKISISQSFLFLCKPYPVKQIFPELNLIDLYCKQQQKQLKGVTYVSNHLKKQNTLATFHPDITHGTFLKECADAYSSKSNISEASEMDQLLTSMPYHRDNNMVECSVQNFHKKGKRKVYFDSSMMDVDCNILEPILAEENRLNAKKCIGDKKYSGPCLLFQKLDNDSNGNILGILVSPLDDLGTILVIRLLTIHKNDNQKYEPKVGSEITLSFTNGIFQIDTKKFSSSSVTIGVRSNSVITVLKLDKNCISWDLDTHVAKFDTTDVVKLLGVLKCQETLVHFCLSPYLQNECLFCTEKGKIYICDYLKQDMEKINDLNFINQNWAMSLYTDNPRNIYIADCKTVCSFNMRTKATKELFNVKTTRFKEDEIWSVSNGINRNELLISTNFMLYLIDNRMQNVPLLEWNINTRFPCHHLCSTQLKSAQTDSVSHSTNVIIIGSQMSTEVQCFQYCDNVMSYKLPPQSIGGPISIPSFKHVYDNLKPKTLLEDKYINARLKSPLRGLDIVCLNKDENSAIIFMLNSIGDVGFEIINLQDHELVFSDLFSSETDTECKAGVQTNYDNWMKAAVAGMEKKCKPFASPAIVGKFGPNFFDTINQQFNKPNMSKHEHCAWCNPDNDYDDVTQDDMNEICGVCGFDVYTSQNLSKTAKPGSSSGSKIWKDPKPKLQRSSLHLIDLDPDTGSEVARLLKGTWSDSYETYWKNLAHREEEDKEKARQQSLDILSQ